MSLQTKNRFYSIQEHHARKLHWDLRLEKGKVLKSWAITKTPPKAKGLKRLAVETEDHDLSYGDFEGEIEEGKYGAGKVKVWDIGTYSAEKWEPNKIVFTLHGKKLKGEYVLIRFKAKEQPRNWLFFRTQ